MGTIGWGVSRLKNPHKAGEEAARAAMEHVGSDGCHSCLLFSTVGYPQQTLLDAVKKEIGAVPMVGCSGTGIIAPGIADESNHALVVLAVADPRVRLITAGYPDVRDSSAAAEAIGTQLKGAIGEDARFLLLLPCGLNVVADELIEGLERTLEKAIPFVGGTAAENWRRQTTFQYRDWVAFEGGISAALFRGDFRLATAVTHGCVPVGLELEITRAEGNRVFEINHRPAMDVMAEYVGEDIWSDFGKAAIHFCLGQPIDPELSGDYDELIIRFVPRWHVEDKSISLPVKMNPGDRVWMTRRDHQKMFDAAQNSVQRLRAELQGAAPFLVLHFDCAGRGRVVLSESAKMDLIKSLQAGVGPEVPWTGLFTYGELCPVRARNVFHNYTAAIAALC